MCPWGGTCGHTDPTRSSYRFRPPRFLMLHRSIITGSVDLGVELNELTDAVNEITLFHLMLEVLLREVRQADQDVHQHTHLNVLPDELQQLFHHLIREFRIVL